MSLKYFFYLSVIICIFIQTIYCGVVSVRDNADRAEMQETPHSTEFSNTANQGTNQLTNNSIGDGGQQERTVAGDCPNCQRQRQLTEDELRSIRIELIKEKILAKLNITKPPQVPALPMNHPLREQMQMDQPSYEEEHDETKTKEVVIFGVPVKCAERAVSHACIHFDMERVRDKRDSYEITSVDLWVYRRHENSRSNHAIQVTDLSGLPMPHNGIARSHLYAPRKGWIKMKIESKVTIERWLQKPHLNSGLDIRCEHCSRHISPIKVRGSKRPYIVIRLGEKKRIGNRRQKRNINCAPDVTECCMESLEIKFSEIGFDFILQPETYHANYCKGSCSIHDTLSKHGVVLNEALQNGRAPTELTSCCSPTKMEPISILRYDDDNVIQHDVLHDMTVTKCSCEY